MRESHEFRITTRDTLWKEQDGKCGYCGKKIDLYHASLDHIIPIFHSKEKYMKDNFIVTCHYCNVSKSDMIVFTNLFDRVIYPIIDVPYFFQVKYIQTNKFKEEKKKK